MKGDDNMGVARKKKCKCEAGAAAWLLTYGDMTTLLLTFFILMFTVAEIDGQELKLILSFFTGSFGVMEGGLTLQKGPLAQMGHTVEMLPSKQSGNKLAKAFKEAQNQFKPEIRSKNIKLTEDIRGLVISIPGQAYFKPNSAELTQKGKELLDKVSRLLIHIKQTTGVDKQVEIEGHASKEPGTHIWEDNLKISTERAMNTEMFLINSGVNPVIESEKGKAAKFIAKGYGEFQPLEDQSDTPEARAYNRRVDIVIKRD